MKLAYTDGRAISELTGLRTAGPVDHAPVEFSAEVSADGVALLGAEPAPFYRASDGEARFTLTIDSVHGVTIAGTIRRR